MALFFRKLLKELEDCKQELQSHKGKIDILNTRVLSLYHDSHRLNRILKYGRNDKVTCSNLEPYIVENKDKYYKYPLCIYKDNEEFIFDIDNNIKFYEPKVIENKSHDNIVFIEDFGNEYVFDLENKKFILLEKKNDHKIIPNQSHYKTYKEVNCNAN